MSIILVMFRKIMLMNFFVGLVLIGCMGNQEDDLREQFAQTMTITRTAQQQAFTHWDGLLLGSAANCQQGLAYPQLFTLTQAQADAQPHTLAMRDSLNASIQQLQVSAELWDAICVSGDNTIAPEQIDKGYKAALAADMALTDAEAMLSAWQP